MPRSPLVRALETAPGLVAGGLGGGGGSGPPPSPAIPGFYGSGAAGDVVLPPGPSALVAPVYSRSYIVPLGSTLRDNGFPVFATSFIRIAGLVDVSGFNAPGGGLFGAGQAGGLNGGAGVVNAAGGNSQAPALAVLGGLGGDGAPGTAGAGGTAVGPDADPPQQTFLVLALPIRDIGGGGGAGGGDVANPGGGGGGGGGLSIFVAPLIIVEATGVIDASGGNGAPSPGGTAGPGGGGGGGLIYLISPAVVLLAGSTLNVDGGLAGGAGAFAGQPGAYIPLTV